MATDGLTGMERPSCADLIRASFSSGQKDGRIKGSQTHHAPGVRPVVFAGPSIYGIEPELLRHVELRPPAACGDLLRAAKEGAKVIGLIDGVFESCPSVWHKEILFALSKGITVYGAASMGALRAAECAAYGMIGVGAIFEDHIAGRRVADSDVAVLHAPAELGYRPLTEALVNVEATVDLLAEWNLIGSIEARSLFASAHSLQFKQRTWESIVVTARLPPNKSASFTRLLPSFLVDRKAQDAQDLFKSLKKAPTRTKKELATRVQSHSIFLGTRKDVRSSFESIRGSLTARGTCQQDFLDCERNSDEVSPLRTDGAWVPAKVVLLAATKRGRATEVA